MATQDFLPDHDQDLILAREIGAALDAGSFVSGREDSFLEQLLEFKQNELEEYDTSLPSQALWERIESETKPQARVLPLYRRKAIQAWAAAAAVLIAAFIGFWWLTQDPGPQLIAQSEEAIQVINLDDGTEVTLRPYSRLFEEVTDESQRSYSISGEAFFDVATDPDRPFTVVAGSGTVTVLGTRFNVSSWGDQTKVYLEEGSVRFSSSTNESVVLQPGQSSSIVAGALAQPQPDNGDKFTDWINNSLVFEGTAPAEVIAEIEQHFNITVTISELEDESVLDGTLRLDSLEQTLEDLGLVLGGTFRQTGEDSYSFTPLD